MNLDYQGRTDVGRRRDHNEDSFLVNGALGLFAVADGMGGHAGGETASRIAVETLERVLLQARQDPDGPFREQAPADPAPLIAALRGAVDATSSEIYEEALRNPALAGMGTTLTALLFFGGTAFVAHVGDSRAYLVRDGALEVLTEDHSMVNEQVKAGVLTPEEARHSQFKNVITRSVGFEPHVDADLSSIAARPGDTFLLCSDGLTNLVDDEEIADAAARLPVGGVPEALIDLANERGGDDNVTVVVVRLLVGAGGRALCG